MANPIMVDNDTAVEESKGGEVEIKENEVAVPIPVPGRLVPIEEVVQVLPDELVSTQITFKLADEDQPPFYEQIVILLSLYDGITINQRISNGR